MPYPSEHYLLAFGGPLRGGEIWTMGLRMTAPSPPGGEGPTTAALDSLHAALKSWWVGGISSNAAGLAWSKLNRILPSGKYADAYTIRKDEPTPVYRNVSVQYPNQIALVATLTTGLSRGMACRGRMFFPVPAVVMEDSDGRLSTASATAAATNVAALLNNLNAATGGCTVGIFSKGGLSGVGASRPVTGVEVGRVLDTMRTRRSALIEARSAVALAAAP